MSLRALTRIPARVRLAYQLLREYETEPEPMTAEEARRVLANYTTAITTGGWRKAQASTAASLWKDAITRKAPSYPAEQMPGARPSTPSRV